MVLTNRLAPEKIIERKHAEAAFKYISDHGRQPKWDIWHYRDSSYLNKDAWVVDFNDKKYWRGGTLKLAYLFALKDEGAIKDKEPPFSDAYDKHIRGQWLEYDRINSIWESVGFPPRSNIGNAGGEYNGEHQAVSNSIVSVGCNLLKQFRQVVFHGPPGTGKTYSAKKVLESLLKVDGEGLCDMQGKRWNIVQFHPSYNYEDFVRGIKVGTDEEKINYETENRIFGKMCENAAADEQKRPYALIIDEINRANVSAVLGELIYALEYRGEPIDTPYAIGKDENKSAELTIPENLYIIGTMNAADRTIGQIDYAVRRRFAFVHCPPSRSVIEKEVENSTVACSFFDDVKKVFDNHISQDFESDDVRIGHSYFLAEGDELAYRILYQVVPILREYVKDGVLLEGAKSDIDSIEERVKEELFGDKSEGTDLSPEEWEDPNPEIGDSFFHWQHESHSESNPCWGLDGVGNTARRIIENYIQRNPDKGVGKLNEIFGNDTVFPADKVPADKNKYFSSRPVNTNQGLLYITNQWAARNPNKRWIDFQEPAKNLGYFIRECRFITIMDDDTRDWNAYRHFGFLSASGKSEKGLLYADTIKKLPVGTIVFAFLLSGSSGKKGFVGMGEVTAPACPIRDFRYEGVKLLDCKNESGKIYKEKFPKAQELADNDDECEWCLGVRWEKNKTFSREEAAEGIWRRGHIVFHVISQANMKIVKAKFETN